MATKADVDLAGKMAEYQTRIKEIHARKLKFTMDEEARREAWTVQFYKLEGELRAAQALAQGAGDADQRIVREVPLVMRQEAQNAASTARAADELVARVRMESQAAQEGYDRRIRDSKQGGLEPLTKSQIETYVDDIALKKGALLEQEKARKDLQERAKKLQGLVDAEVVRIKKAAK